MELLKQYIEEINLDLQINPMNLKEVQMRLPARKHFWVARLINAKIELGKLEKSEKSLREQTVKKINEKSPVTITNQQLLAAVNDTEDMKKLSDRIKEYRYIIEYLEKVEKIFSQTGYEIKNIIALEQMEQM